eukprot:40731-Eustigmatos_ZCMA.PRE.1
MHDGPPVVRQELVAERDRNVVGGFQNTLQSIFELVSFIMVFCLSRPDQFGISALVSYCMTVGAAVVYSAFVLKEAILRAQVTRMPDLRARSHRLHLERVATVQ